MKKGQGAMEYLMTYGWAILVVLIVGIVLWKTGLFGTRATGQSGFDVLIPAEWKISNGVNQSTIIFRNVAGKTLSSVSVTLGTDGNGTYSLGTVGPGKEVTLSNANATCTAGSSAEVNATITYTSNSIQHTDTGTIYADCE